MNVLDVYDSVRGLALDSMTNQEHAIALEARAAIAELIEALAPIDREVPRLTPEEHGRLRAAIATVKP